MSERDDYDDRMSNRDDYPGLIRRHFSGGDGAVLGCLTVAFLAVGGGVAIVVLLVGLMLLGRSGVIQ